MRRRCGGGAVEVDAAEVPFGCSGGARHLHVAVRVAVEEELLPGALGVDVEGEDDHARKGTALRPSDVVASQRAEVRRRQ